MPKLDAGTPFAPLRLVNIHGAPVAIPCPERKWVYLHFARFAACPICNIHVQALVTNTAKLVAANIRQVVIYHSSQAQLLPFQGSFSFDVISDADKALFARFGVGSSPRALLDPRVWPAMLRGQRGANPPKGPAEGGVLGLPADFLVAPDGRLKAVHYGKYATDVWSVGQLLELATS